MSSKSFSDSSTTSITTDTVDEQEQEVDADTCDRTKEVPMPLLNQSTHQGGYLNLVNEHHAQQQQQILQKQDELRGKHPSLVRSQFTLHESILLRPLGRLPITRQESLSRRPSMQRPTYARQESAPAAMAVPYSRRQIILLDTDDASSESSHKADQGVSINETVRNIVDDDQSWSHIREQMKAARIITSLGVHEVCAAYILDKAEEIRQEKINVAKQLEMRASNLSKLRRRLSLFG